MTGRLELNFSIAMPVTSGGNGPGSVVAGLKDTSYIEHLIASPPGVLNTSSFQHVAVTYDKASGNAAIYLNGVSVAQAWLGTFTPRTIGDLYFGLRPYDGGAGMRFVGAADEVSIYSRALSAAEIHAIYAAGTAGKCLMPIRPYFETEPAGQTVVAGDTVSFTAKAAGTAPLGYQWQYMGLSIPGATTSSLTLADVKIDEAGTYWLLASNVAGAVSSKPASLVVHPSEPCAPVPSGMVSWWRGQNDGTDDFGTNNGTLQGGTAFAPGRVGQAFSFDGVAASVVVPDSVGLRLTNQITIECWINASSFIGDQSLVAKVGGSEGNNGYQLMFSGSKLLGQFNSPGQSWPGYRIESEVPTVTGVWNHVAWTYNQSAMKLYWNGVLLATSVIGRHAITPSQSNLRISGDDNLHVYFNGLIDEVSIYDTALSASRIQAIYKAGSTGKCLKPMPPFIVSQPSGQVVAAGSSASLSVAADGSTPLSYEWFFDGKSLSGETDAALAVSEITSNQAGLYSVRVSNRYGSVLSSNATLVVVPAVSSCVPPPAGLVGWWAGQGNANDNTTTNNGVLEGGMSFVPGEVGRAFSFNGTDADVHIPASPSLNVGIGHGLTIEAWIRPGDLDAMRPLVEWNDGSFGVHLWVDLPVVNGGSGPGSLFVDIKDVSYIQHIVFSPTNLLTTSVFQHVAATYDKASGDVVLYLNGIVVAQAQIGTVTPRTIGDLYFGLRPYDGGAGTRYLGALDEVSVYNRALSAIEIAGIYAAGSAGKCALSVAPYFETQPAGQAVLEGATVNLVASAAGTPPLSYQWQLNGSNIAGATTTVLALADVQPSQAGEYSLVASNAVGSVSSSKAVLVVNSTSTCAPVPPGLVSWWKGEENADDSNGLNNGTLVGGVTFAAGEVGMAFDLNGSSQYVDVPDSPSLNPTNQVTVEAWIYPRLPLNPISAPIVKKAGLGASGQIYGYMVEFDGTSAVRFLMYASGGQAWVPTPAGAITVNQWSHVAGLYDGTNASFYLNGSFGWHDGRTAWPHHSFGE